MAVRKIYEGTLEEITAQYGSELRGHRLVVSVADQLSVDPTTVGSAENWVKAFKMWVSTHPVRETFLSDEAVSRDQIYEGRG